MGKNTLCEVLGDDKLLREVLNYYPKTRNLVSRYIDRANIDVLSEVQSHIDPFNDIARAWKGKRKISLTKWCNENKEGSVLVLGDDPQSRVITRLLNRIIIERLSQIVLSNQNLAPNDLKKTWFFLDEFPVLGKMLAVEELLRIGRAKGACLVLAFQDYANIEDERAFGEKLARAIVNSCATHLLLRCTGDMAKWSADRVGEVRRVKRSYTQQDSSANTEGTNTGSGSGTASTRSGILGIPQSEQDSRNSFSGTNSSLTVTHSTSQTEQVEDERMLLPVDFEKLPYASEENGVVGYAVSSFMEGKVWKFYENKKLKPVIDLENKSLAPNFIDREDVEHHYQLEMMLSEVPGKLELELEDDTETRLTDKLPSRMLLDFSSKPDTNEKPKIKSGERLISDFKKTMGKLRLNLERK